MSFSPANLKNVDYKQWIINHFEKVVFVVVVLLVMRAFMNAYWVPFDRTPTELTQMSKDAREQILGNEWPKSEKAKFPADKNIQTQVDQMQSKMDIAALGYNYTTDMFWPLVPRKEKVREPNWFSPRSMLASADRVFVLEIDKEAAAKRAAANAAVTEPEAKEEDNLPSSLRLRGGNRGQTGNSRGSQQIKNNFGGGDFQVALKGFGAYSREAEADLKKQRQSAAEPNTPGAGTRRGQPSFSSANKGKGRRFVSVRGIVPLLRQLESIAEASSLQSPGAARDLLEFNHSEIQRQTKLAGSDTWSEWEDIDIENSMSAEVLRKSGGVDIDIVDPSVTNNVITMPLPLLASGLWDDYVSHPGVENMELSPEQLEEQMKLNELMLAELRRQFEEEKEEAEKNARPAKRGWFSMKTDTAKVREKTLENMSDDEILTKLARGVYSDNAQKAEELKRELVNRRLTPQDNIMLYRYIDFDVDPGSSYRYRVRIIYTNPNLERTLGEVVSTDVIEGDYRETPWSDPTSEVVVPNDSNYFLTNVTKKFGRTLAVLDIFEWKPEFGTTVAAEMGVAVGQFIGGSAKADVAKLNERTFGEEEVNLNTGDVLVDLAANSPIPINDHPDLKLVNPGQNGLKLNDQALVVNRHGNLEVLDPAARQSEYSRVKKMQEIQNREMARLNSGAGGGSGGRGDDLTKNRGNRRGGDDDDDDEGRRGSRRGGD